MNNDSLGVHFYRTGESLHLELNWTGETEKRTGNMTHPIILPRVMREIELLLTTCVVTCVTKLTHPVMSRSHVYLLYSGPLRSSLHTTPHTELGHVQDLDNPL